MKLRQLFKVTMIVMTGFCLLGTDNNNAIASNNVQQQDNTNKFVNELYNYWNCHTDDYFTFLHTA